ncbi:MAG: PxKF domain-containing protein [Actinomycetota bacterium]
MLGGLIVATAPPAAATHFRYRDLTWKRVSGSTVEFTMRIADRRSYHGAPSAGQSWTEHINNFGDGTSGTLTGRIISVNLVDDWLLAEVKGTHTYPHEGPFTVQWESCCTLSSLRNSPDSSLKARAVVDLRGGNDYSPRTSISPIVNVQPGEVRSFRIPAFDDDGDRLSFRLGTQQESLTTNPPDLTVERDTGIITWDARNKLPGLWITTVVVSDGRGAEEQITFLLKLATTFDPHAPSWVEPTPPDRSIFLASSSFTVAAKDPEGQAVQITKIGDAAGLECRSDPHDPGVTAVRCDVDVARSDFAFITFDAQDPNGNSAGLRTYIVGSGRYVAMGDSFASGEGAPPYEDGTDIIDVNMCHRSLVAATRLLESSPAVPPIRDQVACSGATTNNLDIARQFTEPPQLDHLAGDVMLATVGIGGNDVGFGKALATCLVRTVFDMPCAQVLEESIFGEAPGVTERIYDLEERLIEIYDGIRRRAPRARVLAYGYPRFYVDGGGQIGDLDVCVGVLTQDQVWINEKVSQLNEVIHRAALATGIEYVEIYDVFDGHELCSGNEEYMNGLIVPKAEAYHPNAAGHAAVSEYLIGAVESELPGDSFDIRPSQTVTRQFDVEPDQEVASFGTRWPGNDIVMTLQSPSGRIIERSTVADDVVHRLGPTYESYRIANPEAGTWTISMFGRDVADTGEEVNFTAAQFEPLNQLPVAVMEQDGTGSVTFSAAGATDPDGNIAEYVWIFGDGEVGYGPEVTHTYTTQGPHFPTLVVRDDDGALGFAHGDPVELKRYEVVGFDPPVDNENIRTVQAGQTVPLKWRLLLDGDAVSDPASVAAVTSEPDEEACGGTPGKVDETSPGRADLQYLGDGRWRFNWQTPKTYAGQCRTLTVLFDDGTQIEARFVFRG